MTRLVPIFALVLVLLAVAGVLALLARAVRDDGLGHRPPPPVRAEDAHGRTW